MMFTCDCVTNCYAGNNSVESFALNCVTNSILARDDIHSEIP